MLGATLLSINSLTSSAACVLTSKRQAAALADEEVVY
jgi:hypothetical protein